MVKWGPMCGLVIALGEPKERAIGEAVKLLAHRGPDGHGLARVGGAWLGHRRLAIVDPKAGIQPMLSPDKASGIVFNGEIYNHLALRGRLPAGTAFSTHCDTETLMTWVGRHGVDRLAEVEGMYAFGCQDRNGFVAARDPVGIKPLYMMREGGALWFASEIKALHGLGKAPIEEFPPGFSYRPAEGENAWRQFQDLEGTGETLSDSGDIYQRLNRTLSEAVEKRLMADVPVGAFLSGGLDSSLITALMRRSLKSMHTFSVGLAGSADLKNAWTVAEALGTIHHESVFSEGEIVEHLPKIIYYLESYDRDLVRSAIPCYFVSRLAAQYVKVILTGEGSDELFAGYTYLQKYRESRNLRAEVLRILNGLHSLNLQRVDRMTMAHGLEGRVPFLDLKLIRLVLDVDAELKLSTPERMEKWLLRTAFKGALPDDILWRRKVQFDEGTGVAAAMPRLARGRVPRDEFEAFAAETGDHPPRDEEEAWYYKLFREHYDVARVSGTFGRWLPPMEAATA